MYVAGAKRKISPIRGTDGRHAQVIAFDRDRSRDSGKIDVAVEWWQRCGPADVHQREDREDREDRDTRRRCDASHGAQSSETLKICIELVPPCTPESSPLVRMT